MVGTVSQAWASIAVDDAGLAFPCWTGVLPRADARCGIVIGFQTPVSMSGNPAGIGGRLTAIRSLLPIFRGCLAFKVFAIDLLGNRFANIYANVAFADDQITWLKLAAVFIAVVIYANALPTIVGWFTVWPVQIRPLIDERFRHIVVSACFPNGNCGDPIAGPCGPIFWAGIFPILQEPRGAIIALTVI